MLIIRKFYFKDLFHASSKFKLLLMISHFEFFNSLSSVNSFNGTRRVVLMKLYLNS